MKTNLFFFKTLNEYNMRKFLFFISTILILVTTLKAAELTTEINRKQIYIGESIVLTVKVNGFSKERRPDLSSIKKCKIEYLGSHSDNRSSMTITNGKVTRNSFKGRTYRFAITPSFKGSQTIGPIYFDTGKEKLKSPATRIYVQGIEKQNNVIINVKASRKKVLIDSEFDITVDINIKQALKLDKNVAPFNPNDPPNVSIPFLDRGKIPGLKIPDINKLLSPLVVSSRNPGIAINDFSVRNDPFDLGSMFNHPSLSGKQLAKFRLPSKTVTLNNQAYTQYSLTLRYTAEEMGTYTFGPIIFKGTIIEDLSAPERVGQKSVFAVGSAETVEVVPPPEENRPESYIGAIGTWMYGKASLDNQTCNVGEPLKLSIDLSGDFKKDIVYTPEISSQTNLTENFKIYEETAKIKKKKDGVQFSWTIRPINAGTLEIPPIKLSYFNVDKDNYETIRTAAIPVRATENQEADASLVIMTSTNKIRLNNSIDVETIQITDAQPTAITMAPNGAIETKVYGKLIYIYIFLVGPVMFIVILISKILITNIIHNSTTYRQRKALNIFQNSLNNIIKIARQTPKDASGLLYKEIQNFFGNKYEKNIEGLTPMDIKNILIVESPKAFNKIENIIEKHFHSAYSSSNLTPEEITEDCKILSNYFKELDQKKR
jgi:hypothetical protein